MITKALQLYYLVIYVAIGKHRVEVLDTFLGVPVVTILKPFLDCSHVHRIFDYCVVVLKWLDRSWSERSLECKLFNTRFFTGVKQ